MKIPSLAILLLAALLLSFSPCAKAGWLTSWEVAPTVEQSSPWASPVSTESFSLTTPFSFLKHQIGATPASEQLLPVTIDEGPMLPSTLAAPRTSEATQEPVEEVLLLDPSPRELPASPQPVSKVAVREIRRR